MFSQKVFTTVRPPRVAVLINSTTQNWQAQCLHLLDHFSRMWGGSGNIIIPTDGQSLSPMFWKILETFDPDTLLLYSHSGAGYEIENPEGFERAVLNETERWETHNSLSADDPNRATRMDSIREHFRSPDEQFAISPELQNELKLRVAPFYFKDWIVEPGSCIANSDPGYPFCKVIDILPDLKLPAPSVAIPHPCSIFPQPSDYEDALWFGSIFGYCYPNTIQQFAGTGIEISHTQPFETAYQNRSLAFTEIFAKHRRNQRTINDISSIGASFHRPPAVHHWEQPTVIVAGDTIEDFCFFRALSAIRERVVWIHPGVNREILERMGGTAKEGIDGDAMLFLSSIHTQTAYSSQYGSGISLTSVSMGMKDLSEFNMTCRAANGIGRLNSEVASASELIPKHPLRLYEINNAYFPSIAQVADDSRIHWFEQRRPKFLATVRPGKMRWITEVAFDGIALPRHFSIGYWMMGSSQYTTKDMRVSSTGLAFNSESFMVLGRQDSETASTRPTIRVPTCMDAISVVARSSELSCENSDKGLYTAVAIQKFGGLEELAKFIRSDIGKAFFGLFLSTNRVGGVIQLSDERRRYLAFEAINDLTGSTPAANEMCDRFVRNGILNRGYVFQCEYCRRSAWYALAEVSDEFSCRRCRRSQMFLRRHWKTPEQPNIYYQLDEMIFQGMQHDMDVPILTLDFLRRKADRDFGYVEELQIQNDERGEVWGELDIVCVSDSSIVIGETKRSNRLASSAAEENRIIQKYIRFRDALDAEKVVFATAANQWREETERKIRQAFRSDMDISLLGQSELYAEP